MVVYVVTDTNGYVQVYASKESARADIVEALTDHAKRWSYPDQYLTDAIRDLDEDFAAGRVNCGTYLGDYEISCVESTVED